MQQRFYEHPSRFSSFLIHLPALGLLICLASLVPAQEPKQKPQAQPPKVSGRETPGHPTAPQTDLPGQSPAAPTVNQSSDAPVRAVREAVATQPDPSRPSVNESDTAYRIGPGDLLDIRVFNQPQLSFPVRVTTQGTIRLLFAGDIDAACLTERELALAITEKYKRYINSPQVDVFIREYQSQPVAVIGAVERPAQFQLQRRVKLLELITFAGGPKPNAGHSVHVIHSGVKRPCSLDPRQAAAEDGQAGISDNISLSSFKLSELLAGGPSASVVIEPGDVVSVPVADQVFVTGAVVRPSPIQMLPNITLTQAIAAAGGILPDGSKNKVRLLRQDPHTGVRVEKFFNVTDIEKHRAEDMVLEANDVIDVPGSTHKAIFRSLLGQIAPMAGTVPFIIVR
ncbi:MAG TPA: polysaccharide biosynthesis/export family protein [Blastocatellia bacterium]|nr:polysaccharide biosynthesis/export family protein [Blastocatellia bacterium]